MTKHIISGALIALLLSTSLGCNKKTVAGVAGATAHQAAAGESRDEAKRYEALAAGKEDDGDRAAEARAWLDPKNTQNVLWKISRAQTMQFVDELYEAGAKKVYAIYSPKDKTIQVNLCAILLIELPTDSEARKKVYKAFNKIDKRIWGPDHEPEKDNGRKFLELNMDP